MIPCSCVAPGHCPRHRMAMTPRLHARCLAGRFADRVASGVVSLVPVEAVDLHTPANRTPLPLRASAATKPYLRDPATAKLCLHLGPALTGAEVTTYEDQLLRGQIPCRSCSGAIPAHHCTHPDAGPFTHVGGKCCQCVHWTVTSAS